MAIDNRVVKSIRVSPSITEKMKEIAKHLARDTEYYWGSNPHTSKLGYWSKSKISSADVLEIAVLKLHEELFQDKK